MLIIILVALIIIQLIIIGRMTFTERNQTKLVDEKMISTTKKLVEVEENYKTLKQNFDEVEIANQELKSSVNKLTEVSEKLEKANSNLVLQKESLEQKKLQLEEMGKKKDELVAIAIHDIKNPAGAIQGLVEILNSYDLTANEQNELMESLVESSSSILDLAQGISESFANQEFEDHLNLKNSSLKEVIDSIVTLNRANAERKNIRLNNNCSNAIPRFQFDPGKIKEVLDNILSNAIKYSDSDSKVTIKSYFTDAKATIEITDTGIGIPEEEVKKIFDKGVRLSPKPTGGETSSGLGMWIVKKIIDQHAGQVSVSSKKKLGTTVTVALPLSAVQQPHSLGV